MGNRTRPPIDLQPTFSAFTSSQMPSDVPALRPTTEMPTRPGRFGSYASRWTAHAFVLLLLALSQGCLARIDDAFSADRKDCMAAAEAGLAFSEVLAAQQGDPGADFIEVFNPSPFDVEMTGIEIFLGPHRLTEIAWEDDEIEIPAGEYWVLSGAPHELRPNYSGFGYGNRLGPLPASGTLTLRCDDIELDTFTWNDAKPGHSVQLDPNLLPLPHTNDDTSVLCDGTREFSEGRYGTPGSINTPCFESERLCIDELENLRSKDRPQVGELVITEVMPLSAGTGEQWFELYTLESLDLNDITLIVDGARETLQGERCFESAEETRIVFATGDAAAARLPRVDYIFSTPLPETGTLALEIDGVLLDEVSWEDVEPGISRSLDPDHRDETSNNHSFNWCSGSNTQRSGDLGSPGTANPDC